MTISDADQLEPASAVRNPTIETKIALQELEAGKGASFTSVSDLMADLNADD